MKVLILHQHFNTPESGGAIRSYYLAKALVNAGIKVRVITAHNHSANTKVVIEGIEIHYLSIAYENRFGFAERSWAFAKYVWGAIRLSKQFTDVTYCYAISVPLTVGIAAIWIKFWYKIPFIFEVGDLWPDAPVQMGFVKNFFLRHLLYQLEKTIYAEADSIVALSPSIQTAIEKRISDKKIHLLPNMADCDFFKPDLKQPQLEMKYGVQHKFVISYIGAMGLANGLDYFLECANLARKAELPIHFILCGDGALRERLQGNADNLKLKNLSFVNFTNREGVKELLNITDASFISYKPLPVLETGSPNKFFDGLAAGKLMLINFGGWIKKEVEENKCGVYLNPYQPTDFVKKIKPFLSDQALLTAHQQASRQLAEKKYSRNLLSKKFVELFR